MYDSQATVGVGSEGGRWGGGSEGLGRQGWPPKSSPPTSPHPQIKLGLVMPGYAEGPPRLPPGPGGRVGTQRVPVHTHTRHS